MEYEANQNKSEDESLRDADKAIEIIGATEQKQHGKRNMRFIVGAAAVGALSAMLYFFVLPGTLFQTALIGNRDAILSLVADPPIINGVGGVSEVSIMLDLGTNPNITTMTAYMDYPANMLEWQAPLEVTKQQFELEFRNVVDAGMGKVEFSVSTTIPQPVANSPIKVGSFIVRGRALGTATITFNPDRTVALINDKANTNVLKSSIPVTITIVDGGNQNTNSTNGNNNGGTNGNNNGGTNGNNNGVINSNNNGGTGGNGNNNGVANGNSNGTNGNNNGVINGNNNGGTGGNGNNNGVTNGNSNGTNGNNNGVINGNNNGGTGGNGNNNGVTNGNNNGGTNGNNNGVINGNNNGGTGGNGNNNGVTNGNSNGTNGNNNGGANNNTNGRTNSNRNGGGGGGGNGYYACVNKACVFLSGTGTNSCVTNTDCAGQGNGNGNNNGSSNGNNNGGGSGGNRPPEFTNIKPVPYSVGNPAAPLISFDLRDPDGDAINRTTISMMVNGKTVIPNITGTDEKNFTVSYQMPAVVAQTDNLFGLVDTAFAQAVSQRVYVQLSAADMHVPAATGQYDYSFVIGNNEEDTNLCSAPSNLTMVSSGTTVTLNWTASTDPKVTGYTLYIGSTPTSLTRVERLGPISSITLDGFITGQTYYFVLTSTGNCAESNYSNMISGQVGGAGTTNTNVPTPKVNPNVPDSFHAAGDALPGSLPKTGAGLSIVAVAALAYFLKRKLTK